MNNSDSPAYPCENVSDISPGLTKLEYAAIQICAGMMEPDAADFKDASRENNFARNSASFAVKQAKALFTELEKEDAPEAS